jgi:penicillin-binding protein 2
MFRRRSYKVKRDTRYAIEPEEVMLDAKVLRPPEESDDDLENSKLELPIGAKKIVVIAYLAFFMLGAFLFRMVILQGGQADFFAKFVKSSTTRTIYLPAFRGIIYDDKMTPLVSNAQTYDLMVQSNLLPQSDVERSALLAKAAKVINISEDEMNSLLEKGKKDAGIRPVLIKDDLKEDEVIFLKSNLAEFPGFVIQPNYIRDYAKKEPFSHVLGYVGKVSRDDMDQNADFISSDIVGKDGLEKYYDRVLRGRNGKIERQIDVHGKELEDFKKSDPEKGKDLVLSIDANMQSFAYNLLKNTIERNGTGQGGSIVAIDPANGNILAMTNYPSFDNNIFSFKTDPKVYQDIFTNKKRPLFDRALSGQYPSGSTIKPFVALAALEEHVISPTKAVDDTSGVITITNPYNPDVVYRFPDWKAHGYVDMRRAIAESCDVYFYTIGGGFGDIKGLGIDRIKKYLSKFGFGDYLNFDIGGEGKGLLPDAAWKKETKGEDWFIGDTYHASIGQGDVLVTPLQLANGIAAIANGGTLYSPKIGLKIIDPQTGIAEEIKPEVLGKDFVNPANMKVIREGMRQTITSGSARALNALPFTVAGKTGTAQYANNTRTHAWFVAFAPYEDPKVAIAVLVEGGGEGSTTAVPIARDFLKEFFGKME